MNLFNRKPRKELPALLTDEEINAGAGATYEQVLDFLTSVNKSDYEKILKVVAVYRRANIDVSQITGLTAEPTASIFEKQTVETIKRGRLESDDIADQLLDDDDISAAFGGKPGKKVTIKNGKNTKG